MNAQARRRPRRRFSEWFWPLITVVVAGVLLPLVYAHAFSRIPPAARPRAFGLLGFAMAVSLALVYASLVVHELGHVVGCRLVGFGVVEVAVAPVVVRVGGPQGARVRFVWTLLRGWVRPDPVTPEGLRWRDSVFALSGPAANLLLAIPLLIAAILQVGLNGRRDPFDLVIGVAGVEVALMGLLALVPYRFWSDVTWSDGMWLWLWLWHPARAAAAVARGALSVAAERGVRPREWDPVWVRLVAGSANAPAYGDQIGGCLLAYAWALDRADRDEAEAYLELAFNRRQLTGRRLRQAVAIEMAYFLARYRDDPSRAGRILDSEAASPSALLTRQAARARAAAALAAGRAQDALDICEAVLDEVPTGGGGFGIFDRELLEAIRDDALRRMPKVAAGGGGA